MKVTLGGDRRVGSGKKMKVDIPEYGRSTFDLSRIRRTTMSAGTIVPIANILGLKGDKFEIDLDADIKTHPTVGPLFGSYKVQIDVFKCDVRLYQGNLHNNETGLGRRMNTVYFPTMTLTAPMMNAMTMEPEAVAGAQLNPSSVVAHLGMAGIGQRNPISANGERDFNATALIAYYDTVKNYYSNHPEKIGYFIHSGVVPLVTTVDEIYVNYSLGGADILVEQLPTVAPVHNVQNLSYLKIKWTGGYTPLNQIILQLQGAPDPAITWEVRASQMVIVSEDLTETILRWNLDPNSNYTINGWRYATVADVDTTPIQLQQYALGDLDELRKSILSWAFTNGGTPYNLNDEAVGNLALSPWKEIFTVAGGMTSLQNSQEGLAVKTYQSDMFNNWLNSADIADVTNKTRVATNTGSFTMDALNLAQKLYNIENRVEAAGGDWYAWQEAITGLEVYRKSEIPVYMGGLSKELVFEEIVSNAEANTGGGRQPLGTLAGKGRMGGKHKGGRVTINVDEPCVILILASLTPRPDYSQGNDFSFGLQTLDDLHKPELDGIGFQDMIAEQFAYWTTTQHPAGHWTQSTIGKQTAWIQYQTAVNEAKGNFALPEEMFMTLNRRYEPGKSGTWFNLLDATTYIDPAKYNHIFAMTALDSQNFWANFKIDVEKRSIMSSRVMPNM